MKEEKERRKRRDEEDEEEDKEDEEDEQEEEDEAKRREEGRGGGESVEHLVRGDSFKAKAEAKPKQSKIHKTRRQAGGFATFCMMHNGEKMSNLAAPEHPSA